MKNAPPPDGDAARLEWAFAEAENPGDVPYRIKMALQILAAQVADLKEKLHDADTVIFDANLKINAWKREEQTWCDEAQRLHRIIAAAKTRLEPLCQCHEDPCEFHRLVEED